MSLTKIHNGIHRYPLFLSVLFLLIAMISIQSGASLAKSLFPLVGAPGVTAIRLGLGTLILCAIFKPWRLHVMRQQRISLCVYGLALGGMNYLFYLAIQRIPLGIAVALEFTGPLAVALLGSRRFIDVIWGLLALCGLWFLLPLHNGIQNIDLHGALLALGAGVFWAIYILVGRKAGANLGAASVALGSLIACVIFVPTGLAFAHPGLWSWSLLPAAIGIAILSSALPYSLEMIALTRMPARTFGTLMSLEPAMAALAGMTFLGEKLMLIQWIGLAAIIFASSGATLTLRTAKTKIAKINDKKDS